MFLTIVAYDDNIPVIIFNEEIDCSTYSDEQIQQIIKTRENISSIRPDDAIRIESFQSLYPTIDFYS